MSDTPSEREGAGLWAGMRRRKVVQWGLVYVAAAWGFLQGLEYVTETFHWPERLRQISFLALLIGLPIVLVVAWYHGDRGERQVTRTELAILTLLFLVGGGIFWLYDGTSEDSPTTSEASVASGASINPEDARPSVAVLPFENRSREADDAFFVDGIHDDILTQLSKISALRVISRTSVERFRKTDLPLKDIAQQLGVKRILEGGVQRGGDRVRVNVQLIDAATDAHLWAETYDRELTAANIFAIQSELAQAIARALKATLTAGEKARVDAVPTQNLAAWEAYQLGMQRVARRTSESLADAERFFREAIDLDPKFALAHVGLADTLTLQIDYSGKPAEFTFAEATQAIASALALDANLPEAWASKGLIAMGRAQNDSAERMLRRAIALNPNYAAAHHWLSMILRSSDRREEELEHAERAAQLDPLSGVINTNLGNSFEMFGRFDEAAARYRRAIELDPTSSVAYLSLATLNAYARNRFPDAVLLTQRAIALDPGSPRSSVYLGLIYLDIDDALRARHVVSSMIERWPDDFYSNVAAAVTYQMQGDSEAAERYARKALATYLQEYLSLAVLRNADLRTGDLKSARARYASAFPELISLSTPRVNSGNLNAALDLALVLQRTGELDRVSALLNAGEEVIRSRSRLGESGYGISDAQVHALRGDKSKALAALRKAEKAGWRGILWRYYRDIDPNLAPVRSEPEFKVIFADIERDMARQRAALAARPKDAPLEIAGTGT